MELLCWVESIFIVRGVSLELLWRGGEIPWLEDGRKEKRLTIWQLAVPRTSTFAVVEATESRRRFANKKYLYILWSYSDDCYSIKLIRKCTEYGFRKQNPLGGGDPRLACRRVWTECLNLTCNVMGLADRVQFPAKSFPKRTHNFYSAYSRRTSLSITLFLL